MENNFADLIKAASLSAAPAVSPNLERRVMIEVARRAIARSRQRAKRGVVASLAGLAMLFAGCMAALVVWFPTLLPASTGESWLMKPRATAFRFFDVAAGSEASSAVVEAVPLLEQWGGLMLIVLAVCGVAGFIYYLNSLFSNDYKLE